MIKWSKECFICREKRILHILLIFQLQFPKASNNFVSGGFIYNKSRNTFDLNVVRCQFLVYDDNNFFYFMLIHVMVDLCRVNASYSNSDVKTSCRALPVFAPFFFNFHRIFSPRVAHVMWYPIHPIHLTINMTS